MKILFDIGHPAHVHYFKNLIGLLEKKGHDISITARDKDIALYLLDTYGFTYSCTGKNLSSKVGKIYSIFRNDYAILKVAKKFRPDLIVSFFSPFASHVGKLLNIPVIGFNDTEHAKLSILLTKPFTDVMVVPECYHGHLPVRKRIKFNGYFELAYLHPNYFTPDPLILKQLGVDRDEKYVVLRFVSWNAGHDFGHTGIHLHQKIEIVQELSKKAKVFISSEDELPSDLRKYKITASPEKMHDVLAFASLFIGEGATMASECAMLGTPAFYVNCLELGYCTELEQKYGLVYNFRKADGVLKKAVSLQESAGLKQEFKRRRDRMLNDKIDVTAFMLQLIESHIKQVD